MTHAVDVEVQSHSGQRYGVSDQGGRVTERGASLTDRDAGSVGNGVGACCGAYDRDHCRCVATGRGRGVATLALAACLLTACRSSQTIDTPRGRMTAPCVGVNDEKRPDLRYEYSVRNIVLGVVFFEMIVPPIYVVLKRLECPVEWKPAPSTPRASGVV